jgi:hypothetical protein
MELEETVMDAIYVILRRRGRAYRTGSGSVRSQQVFTVPDR